MHLDAEFGAARRERVDDAAQPARHVPGPELLLDERRHR